MTTLKKTDSKPKVLFISGELISGDLAYRLQLEGCDVRLFIEDIGQKKCLDGIVRKTKDWRKDLVWVGKDGLVIFDDVGDGETQDSLRKEGYLVVGGGKYGDRLELDREYGQEVFKKSGVSSGDFGIKNFTLNSAIAFVKKNKGTWVAKHNNHDTALNYVSHLKDGTDMVSMLEHYRSILGGNRHVALQRKVDGVEIAIGRFFNGKDWVGPSVINFEHKHLCNDDIGPLGGETGTLMWYEDNENHPLFQRTLAKIKMNLQENHYKGYVDINCIVQKDVVYPLEFTCRFGSSTVETQGEIQISPWHELLMALAKGDDYRLKYKKGYCVNVGLTVPPFPYRTTDPNLVHEDVLLFLEKVTKMEMSHVRFEGVLAKKEDDKIGYYTAGNLGYVLYVTAIDKHVEEARAKVYNIIRKIILPKSFYRTDIGARFINKDRRILEAWGWI